MFANMKTLYTKDQIQERIHEMAAEIDKLYSSLKEPIIAICVLRGAVYFFTDLTRAMKTELLVDMVKMGSYGDSTTSSGLVTFDLMPSNSLENRHVLIVEDIIDTGHSMHELLAQLQIQKPKSIHVASLLSKQSRRAVHDPIHFVGFEIPDHFVVGMGMDCGQKHRNLDHVAYFTDEEVTETPVEEPAPVSSWLPSFLRG